MCHRCRVREGKHPLQEGGNPGYCRKEGRTDQRTKSGRTIETRKKGEGKESPGCPTILRVGLTELIYRPYRLLFCSGEVKDGPDIVVRGLRMES